MICGCRDTPCRVPTYINPEVIRLKNEFCEIVYVRAGSKPALAECANNIWAGCKSATTTAYKAFYFLMQNPG